MILGDGGVGKTTLAWGLQWLEAPAITQQQLRSALNARLPLWTATDTRAWLCELDPLLKCPASKSCAWCDDSLPDAPASFSKLLRTTDDIQTVMQPHPPSCLVAKRVRLCVTFLTAPADDPDQASADPLDELTRLRSKIAKLFPQSGVAKLLEDPEDWPDFAENEEADWKESGLKPPYPKKLVRALTNVTAQRDKPVNASPSMDTLRVMPHVPTRGIKLEGASGCTLWDFAGQPQYLPAHQFVLASDNVTFVLVVDATFSLEACLQRLCHWCSVIHSTIQSRGSAAFGCGEHQADGLSVLLVASHTDSPSYRKTRAHSDMLPQLAEKLQQLFSPALDFVPGPSGPFFCPDYERPDGGDLQQIAERLAALSQQQLRLHRLPNSYLDVNKRLIALKAQKQPLPIVGMSEIEQLVHDVDPSLSPSVVVESLQAYGFVKQVSLGSHVARNTHGTSEQDASFRREPSHCLIDPVTWLSEMCALLIHPLQDMPATGDATVAVPTLTVRGVRAVLDAAEQTKGKFNDEQAYQLLRLLQLMDICFEYDDARSFVFPSLLPPCQTTELALPSGIGASFGRRFVLNSETDVLPPGLFVNLARVLCCAMNKNAVHVVVLRQHVLRLFVLDACYVTVCFNAGSGSTGRLQPHACTSFDLAVAARDTPQRTAMESALQSLNIITSELAGVCSRAFSQLKLQAWAFAKATDEEEHMPQLHPLKAVGHDRVYFSKLVAAAVHSVVDEADQQIAIALMQQSDRQEPEKLLHQWQQHCEKEKRPMSSSLRQMCTSRSHDRSPRCAQGLVLMLSALSTDPLWSLQTLAAPDSILPPERFGLQTSPGSQRNTTSEMLQSQRSSRAEVLHDDAMITVFQDVFGGGEFGDCMRRTRHKEPKDIVTRIVRGEGWRRQHLKQLNDGHAELCRMAQPAQHVVAMAYSCIELRARELLLIPLFQTGLDLPLPQAVGMINSCAADRALGLPGLVIDICRGLKELHQCGIVHGRLSLPSSVVVGCPRQGEFCARVADWCVPLDDGFVDDVTLKATLVAPELRSGSGHQQPTQQSDLYSLGVLTHVVLSGGGRATNEHPTSDLTTLFPDLTLLDGAEHFPGCFELLSVWMADNPEEREAVGTSLDTRFLLQLHNDGFADLLEAICSLSELEKVVTRLVHTLSKKSGAGALKKKHQQPLEEGKRAVEFLNEKLWQFFPPTETHDWKFLLDDKDLMGVMDGNRRRNVGLVYDRGNVVDLLRCFRNLRHHPEQMPGRDMMEDRGLFVAGGVSHCGIGRYFFKKFPRCAYATFQLMRHADRLPDKTPATFQDPRFNVSKLKNWFLHKVGPLLIAVTSKDRSISDAGTHFTVLVPEGEAGHVSVVFFSGSATRPEVKLVKKAAVDNGEEDQAAPDLTFKQEKERCTVNFELPRQGKAVTCLCFKARDPLGEFQLDLQVHEQPKPASVLLTGNLFTSTSPIRALETFPASQVFTAEVAAGDLREDWTAPAENWTAPADRPGQRRVAAGVTLAVTGDQGKKLLDFPGGFRLDQPDKLQDKQGRNFNLWFHVDISSNPPTMQLCQPKHKNVGKFRQDVNQPA